VSGPTSNTSASGSTKSDCEMDSTALPHRKGCNQDLGSVTEICSNASTGYPMRTTTSLSGFGCRREYEMDADYSCL